MRLRIVSILIATVLAGNFSGMFSVKAVAQGQPVVNTLKISLWPEYDRPSMLVIYRAMLSQDTALPVNMVFRIPLTAQPFVVAVGAALDSVSEVNYTQNVSGEWREIRFPATFPAIQFEYYDSGLLIDNQARHFEYVWPGDYQVKTITLEIQKPLGATGVKIVPNIGEARLGDDDVEYYSTEVGALPAGQLYKVMLDYQKATSKLTAEQMPVKTGQSVPADSPEKERLRNIMIGSGAILGVVLVLGAVWWYWRSGRKEERPEHRRRSRGAREPVEEEAASRAIYCHQCGKRAASGDRFCRSCGARLRTE